ncbi:hypothetical protein ACEPAG_8942 [Sanghuangporus baumii]
MEEEKPESTPSGQPSDYDPEKAENPRCYSEFVPKCSENGEDSGAKPYSAQHHSVVDTGQAYDAHQKHYRDNAMVQISLPTISRLSARVQNMQSAMGKFGDISLVALAQALASYALRLFFLDEFRKYYSRDIASYLDWRWQRQHQHDHQYIELQIDMLTKSSILCSVYVVFHSLALALTKRFSNGKLAASASVFEVIVPLAFGTVTIFLAILVFIEWKKDPDLYCYFSYYYYEDAKRDSRNFLTAISIFLLIWFVYLRVRPLVLMLRRKYSSSGISAH